MFESEVRDVIAERVEKVVVAVMMRAEKFLGLVDEILVVVPDELRGVEGSGTVGGDVHFGGRVLSEWDDFQKFSGDDWRIDERSERAGGEVNLISALIC